MCFGKKGDRAKGIPQRESPLNLRLKRQTLSRKNISIIPRDKTTVQDDRRENELITLFQLEKPANATRSGTDAILNFANQQLAFELKSTTKSSVTTVRDFSPDHINKWQGKHWLFGFYEPGGKPSNTACMDLPKQWLLEFRKKLPIFS